MEIWSHLKLYLSMGFYSTYYPYRPVYLTPKSDLSCTKINYFTSGNLAAPKARDEHELEFNKPASGNFVTPKASKA